MFSREVNDVFPIYIHKETGSLYAVIKKVYMGSTLNPNTIIKIWCVKRDQFPQGTFTSLELFDMAEYFEFAAEEDLLKETSDKESLSFTATTIFNFN